jgi:penicillin-binding protein 1B
MLLMFNMIRKWWLWALFALIVAAFAGYVFYLDSIVRIQFEGKRWALPAHVYARPLELYPDQALTSDQFSSELKMLGYRSMSKPRDPGTYLQRGGSFVVVTRPFQFWDGAEPSRYLRVEFSGGRVLGMWRANDGEAVDIVRLDPPQIGSIYPSHNEDRVLVKLENVPRLLIDALLATEDRDFFQHHGISPRSILRAMLANLRAGQTVQGGSTLTQQLVKNFFLSNERTLWRKFNEAIMALLLEWHYEKDEIIEAYINEIYLGQDGRRAIHGFGLASQFYFGRPLNKLKPGQIALLVALVKGPSYYDPRRRPLRASKRRNLVLQLLEEQEKLSSEAAQLASETVSKVLPQNSTRVSRVPAFIDLVRRQLRRDYSEEDLNSEGLRIFTTLDPMAQRKTERALSEQITHLDRGGIDHELQGAAVVVNVNDGEVQAIVGGRDPRFAGFNRALDAVRPVGSLIKPAVYLTALLDTDQYTLATLLDDGPLDVDLGGGEHWQPKNFDHENHGHVLLHDALSHSYNLSTARLGLKLGVPAVTHTLKALGAQRSMTKYPALLLGAVNFSPLDVAQMYHTLAAGGFRTPLRAIRAVLTADGKPLQRYPLSVTPAFDSKAVFLLNTALQSVTREGTGRSLRQLLPEGLVVAGKTGTTDDLRDSWFAGFSENHLAVVWLGMDDNQPAGLTGSSGALRVWGEIMSRLDTTSLSSELPLGMESTWIDRRTGLRIEEDCPHGLPLPFIEGPDSESTAPVEEAACEWK